MLTPELAIGIRRVKGVKRLGRRIGNWLSGDQAQTIGSRGVAIGSDPTEGRPLGHRRSVWQGRTAANGARSRLVQGFNG